MSEPTALARVAGLAAALLFTGAGLGGASGADAAVAIATGAEAVPAGTSAPDAASAVVSVDLDEVSVAALPCSTVVVDLALTNPGDEPIYADALVTGDDLDLSASIVSSYLLPGYTFTEQLRIQASQDTQPGAYEVEINSGDSRASIAVEVEPSESDNVALAGVPDASSVYPGRPPCGAIDGVLDSEQWTSGIGWSDNTNSEFPDWWMVTFPEPAMIGRVDLYTVDSAQLPAETQGMRDWDIQVLDGASWRTVAEVRGNTSGMVSSSFPVEEVSALRVHSLAANGNYSRIVELEAYLE